MRALMFELLVGLLGLTAVATAKAPFVGTWEAKVNDLPGVEIRLEEAKGRLRGVVVFFFQRRGDDGKWHVEGDDTGVPMLVPRVKGKILSFEVLHHKSHGGTELGPNVKFRLELTGTDEARLRKIEDQPDAPGTGIKLTRRQ